MDNKNVPAVDLRQLHYFMTLAEHGSISAAAATLGLAQPSLSESITRLERRLEVQLAVRSARGVQLTEAGLALARHAKELVRNAEIALQEIQYLGGEPRGPVTLGLSPSLGLLLTVPLAETIRLEYPEIRLSVTEVMSSHTLDLIELGRLQLGLVNDMPPSANLLATPLLEEDLFLVAAPDNWDGEIDSDGRAIASLNPQEVARLPLIAPNLNNGLRTTVERFARATDIELNIIMEIDSLPQTIEMVHRASGYAIMPYSTVVKHVAAGTMVLIALTEPGIRRTVHLVTKRSAPLTRGGMAVVDAIKLILRELVSNNRITAVTLNFTD